MWTLVSGQFGETGYKSKDLGHRDIPMSLHTSVVTRIYFEKQPRV